jgi:hypothetical protein
MPITGVVVGYGGVPVMPGPSAPSAAFAQPMDWLVLMPGGSEEAEPPVQVRHEFMQTCSSWTAERLMELGEQGYGTRHGGRRLVRFAGGPWHGDWCLDGSVLYIWWHYTGKNEKVGETAKCYTKIPRTGSWCRGSRGGNDWFELLSAFNREAAPPIRPAGHPAGFMHTSCGWPTAQVMELGELGTGTLADPKRNAVRFAQGTWHGHWRMHGEMLYILWNEHQQEEMMVGAPVTAWKWIRGTGAWHRGQEKDYEVLSPCLN